MLKHTRKYITIKLTLKTLQIINSLGTGGAEKLLLETIPLYRKKGIEMDILLLWDNDSPFTKALKELDCCNIFVLSRGGSHKKIYNPLHILKLSKYIKKYDLIHVHLFPAQYWVAIAKIIFFSKSILIFTEHNTHNRRAGNKLFYLADRFIYSRYDSVICITTGVREMLKRNYANWKNKLQIIQNGIPKLSLQ